MLLRFPYVQTLTYVSIHISVNVKRSLETVQWTTVWKNLEYQLASLIASPFQV